MYMLISRVRESAHLRERNERLTYIIYNSVRNKVLT